MSWEDGEFQTRRESGEIRLFRDLAAALADAADLSVWKVSFPAITGERVRLVRNDSGRLELPLLMDEVAKELGHREAAAVRGRCGAGLAERLMGGDGDPEASGG